MVDELALVSYLESDSKGFRVSEAVGADAKQSSPCQVPDDRTYGAGEEDLVQPRLNDPLAQRRRDRLVAATHEQDGEEDEGGI